MTEPKLDWATAEVHDQELTVEVDGDPSKDWRQSFDRTASLLGSGQWQQVELKKRTVHVSGVSPGAEDKLRHFLESLVQQANADLRAVEERSDDRSDAQNDEREKDADERDDSPETQMTERFRSFGGDDGTAAADPTP